MKLFAKLFLLLIITSAINVFGQDRSEMPAKLIGSWSEGSASLLQEQNVTTGQISSSYGSSIGYKFNDDGTFQYAGLIKSTLYGCTTSLWNDKRGTYEISGEKITLTAKKDYWLNTNSCYPSSNKEKYKDPQEETFEYEIGFVKGKEWLCMRKDGGDGKILCYPRAND